MKPRAYVETSVISYLASRTSRDLVTAAHQRITREWWKRRDRFDLYVSELAIIEAGRGDARAAGRRLQIVAGFPIIELNDDVRSLAHRFVDLGAVARGSDADAAHIAAAAVHRMELLVTWNCKHIANAMVMRRIAQVCKSVGLAAPTICTPEQIINVTPPFEE